MSEPALTARLPSAPMLPLSVCVPPPNSSVVPGSSAKVPECVPPTVSRSVPPSTLKMPPLLNASPITFVWPGALTLSAPPLSTSEPEPMMPPLATPAVSAWLPPPKSSVVPASTSNVPPCEPPPVSLSVPASTLVVPALL